MSAMLVLRCVAPAFALVGAATVWAMAGPLAAGLALVIFLLGVATSELHHLRWSRVDEAGFGVEEFGAPAPEVHEGRGRHEAPGPEEAEAPAEPALSRLLIAPKRDFQCVRQELAIGSGLAMTALAERSRRVAARPAGFRPAAEPVVDPVRAEAPVPSAAPLPAAAPMPELAAAPVFASVAALAAAANDAPLAEPAPAPRAAPAPSAAVPPAEPLGSPDPRTLKFRASYEARLTA